MENGWEARVEDRRVNLEVTVVVQNLDYQVNLYIKDDDGLDQAYNNEYVRSG